MHHDDQEEVFLVRCACCCRAGLCGLEASLEPHLLPRRAGQLRREMGSGEQCASADDCTSAASVDTAGPWRSPQGPYPGAPASCCLSQGEGAVAAGGRGHRFKATAPVSCSFPRLDVLFYFLHPRPWLVPMCWAPLGRACPSHGGTPPWLLL